MPCEIASGYARKTCSTTGGVKAIYVTNFGDIQSLTKDPANPHQVTAITMQTGKKFYVIGIEPESVSFTETPNVNPQGRTIYYETQISLQLPVQTANDIKWLHDLSSGVAAFVVELNDGTKRIIGHEFGCLRSGGDEQSGQAFGDPHVVNLQFTSKSSTPSPFFSGTVPTT
jgi:hypothetical protein